MSSLLNAVSRISAAAILITARRDDDWQTACALAAGNTLIIGSGRSCGLTLEGATIAPMHCLLTFHDGQLVVQEWSTAGSTFLNGQSVSGEAAVGLDDRVAVGDYTLEFAADPAAATSEDVEPAKTGEAADDRREPPDDSPLRTDFARLEPPIACNSFPPDEERDPSGVLGEDAPEEESTELLRAEIRELQCELAERDAQLYELLREPGGGFAAAGEPTASTDESSLVDRLEELLDELAKSDERSALLEEMLRASEEATAAEQEERRQLDAWVGDIEQRISQRESEWQAELELQKKRAAQAREERDDLEKRLRKSASASDAKLEHNRVLEKLREQNADLQNKLEEAKSARAAAEQELKSAEVQNTIEAKQNELDAAIREERAQLAQERAALARMRAELTNKLAEIQQSEATDSSSSGADDRVRALRDHLNEIHDKEKCERSDRGLMSRITGLWKSLDG